MTRIHRRTSMHGTAMTALLVVVGAAVLSCAARDDEAAFRASMRAVATDAQAMIVGADGDWDAMHARYHALQAEGLEAGWLERREIPLGAEDASAADDLREALRDRERVPVFVHPGGHEDFDAAWIWPEDGGAEPIGFEVVGYPGNVEAYEALVLELLGRDADAD